MPTFSESTETSQNKRKVTYQEDIGNSAAAL